ncbi:MAG TPA: protein YgfX [Spongiibacteraceae bacterium]
MSTSFSPSPTALHIEVRPSNYWRSALVIACSSALTAAYYSALLWWQQAVFAAAAIIYFCLLWRAHNRQRGILQWCSTWIWTADDGVENLWRLRHCTIWPGLTVLTFFNSSRKNFTLTLLPDSLDADSARRLRVYLNHFPVFDDTDAAE